jgi:hypothetical protein
MPSTFILIGAVALGTGLICLFGGYLWGRSNVRSQIEDALDQSRRIADAREYNLREALEEKMLELSQLRESAEELPRLREKLEQLKSERMQGSAGGRSNAFAPANNSLAEPKPPAIVHAPAPDPESADKAIQNLLKSIDERMKGTEEDSREAVHESATPAATNFAVEIPPTVTQLHSKPAPPEAPPAKPAPVAKTQSAQAAKDEWQEFAASLAALKNRQK